MNDPKKAAEALKKIEDISRSITNHESSISRVERENNDKVRYYDLQISREEDEIKRLKRQIDDLRRQIKSYCGTDEILLQWRVDLDSSNLL